MIALAVARDEDDLVRDAVCGVLVQVPDVFGKGGPGGGL